MRPAVNQFSYLPTSHVLVAIFNTFYEASDVNDARRVAL